jgi:hypothetical protein
MNLFVIHNYISKETKYLTLSYVSCSLIYTLAESYKNAKKYLLIYRNQDGKLNFKSEWDAVIYGANIDFYYNFFNSLIWPYNIITQIVPRIVLFLNPK